jgi:hypothetical protein
MKLNFNHYTFKKQRHARQFEGEEAHSRITGMPTSAPEQALSTVPENPPFYFLL